MLAPLSWRSPSSRGRTSDAGTARQVPRVRRSGWGGASWSVAGTSSRSPRARRPGAIGPGTGGDGYGSSRWSPSDAHGGTSAEVGASRLTARRCRGAGARRPPSTSSGRPPVPLLHGSTRNVVHHVIRLEEVENTIARSRVIGSAPRARYGEADTPTARDTEAMAPPVRQHDRRRSHARQAETSTRTQTPPKIPPKFDERGRHVGHQGAKLAARAQWSHKQTRVAPHFRGTACGARRGRRGQLLGGGVMGFIQSGDSPSMPIGSDVTSDAPQASLVVLISGCGNHHGGHPRGGGETPDTAPGLRPSSPIGRRRADWTSRARRKVPTAVVPLADFPSRAEWDRGVVKRNRRVLSRPRRPRGLHEDPLRPATVAHFAGRIINTHPALLPVLPGSARRPRRARPRGQGDGMHGHSCRRGRRHRADRRPGDGRGARRMTRRSSLHERIKTRRARARRRHGLTRS